MNNEPINLETSSNLNTDENLFTADALSELKRESDDSEKVRIITYEILNAANCENNLNEFFEFIHSLIAHLMNVDNFFIALYYETDNTLSFPYYYNKKNREIATREFGNDLTEYLIKNGTSVLLNETDILKLVKSGKAECRDLLPKIWLGIPLKIKDNTFGALVVHDDENEATYGKKEKDILEMISFAVSRAIERKKNEQEKNDLIRQLQEMNAAKDRLISHISHDLRSPFNSLLGFSEILTTEYDTLTKEEIQEYLSAVYEASKNLFGMTNNLLQFSRFQMGRMEFKPINLNLLRVANRSINLLKGNAVKKQLSLKVNIDNDMQVFADEDMLISIIQNLVSNAIKFTNKSGEIQISAVKSANENEIEISVVDSGIGISKDDLKKIFGNSFYSTPGTDREYGTGLGLILVKEFIESNEGKIFVNSTPGLGSKFRFTLPAAK